jgi:hypothetical protein
MRRRDWRSDRGQISAFVVTLMATLLLFGGLVLDGGLALAAKVNAIGQAQEAARAGAQAIDLDAFREDGTIRLDPDHARALAQDYLNAAGAHGTVRATTTEVTVTITHDQPTQLLQIAGLTELSVTASGTARPEPGVTGAIP